MKYYNSLLLLLGALFIITACENKTEIPYTATGITVNHPANIEGLVIKSDTLVFRNITSGLETKIPGHTLSTSLPEGLYDCDYKAEVTYDNDGAATEGMLKGSKESVQVIGGSTSFSIDTYLLVDKQDFIIEEIFFTGTLRSSGKQYYGDGYVKIYNNTDKVLYADGLALLETKFTSTEKYDYNPDIRQDTMTVQAIYVIPGSGKEHPVQPGESMILCDTGIDHRLANPNSFDLSRADFEWYDISTQPNNMDIDSETVPNLDKYYCYTLSFWVLHNRGLKSYALARIQENKETYLKKYAYSYRYTVYLPSGTFPMEGTAYKIPNSWIVDGVNCSVASERKWNLLPSSIDSGWTYCGSIDADKTRYFKSVRRKMLSLTEGGRRILKDTNNSSEDFNPECVPSIIEEQGAAIDANGTPATVITYDGVQPKSEK